MPRRKKTLVEEINQLQEKIDYQFNNSPLEKIGQHFIRILEYLRSLPGSSLSKRDWEGLITGIEKACELLPNSNEIGERFYFDSQLIQQISDELVWDNRTIFPARVIPRYEKQWGHYQLKVPNFDQKLSIDLIYFPEETPINNINLLEYPFLLHELGHILVLLKWEILVKPLQNLVRDILKPLKISTISLNGIAQQNAKQNLQRIENTWSTQWIQEIISDLFALWVSGPAYLVCFYNTLLDQKPKPYHCSKHPPYFLRVQLLVKAAEKLHLDQFTPHLNGLLDQWKQMKLDPQLWNEYTDLARLELIQGCLERIFEIFEKVHLPVMNLQQTRKIKNYLEDTRPSGINLLVSAGLLYKSKGENEYSQWENNILSICQKQIKQEYLK